MVLNNFISRVHAYVREQQLGFQLLKQLVINSFAADPIVQYMTQAELQATIDKSKKEMEKASKDLDFIMAAKWRDDMYALEHVYNEKFTK